jgi:DDE domain
LGCHFRVKAYRRHFRGVRLAGAGLSLLFSNFRFGMAETGFVPKAIVTDKLRSYGAALREIGFSGLHEQGLRANNRAENSHLPLRRRVAARVTASFAASSTRVENLSAREPYRLISVSVGRTSE